MNNMQDRLLLLLLLLFAVASPPGFSLLLWAGLASERIPNEPEVGITANPSTAAGREANTSSRSRAQGPAMLVADGRRDMLLQHRENAARDSA